ncbi:tetratricopeptide repeat protein [Aggregicoccus sp. 17bor-14]|uniref:tetratricopeptide repeat protein n=1 Tax=Myxococcaceae TaxID=31 RepID=UPI00129D1D0D|nr:MULTISPECIES: tetratricopeptide repeat protein [Myxococcaceae]MBF5041090.1 tetratricopeptide repeat protein [Simulacricoccus sp. 17bor-14]MRI86877.1 tetratricopeptide repeat protein [Aggregicoccus sp. 17bor-14]
MTQQTNWIPGLVVLGLVFVAASLYLLFTRRAGGAAAPESAGAGPGLADLERRYQGLLEQLKELSTEQHHLPAEQYAQERSRLEHEAAAVLRERDAVARAPVAAARAQAPAPAAAAPGGFLADRPQLRGALWGAGIVLFFGALSYVLVSEQRERDEQGVMTGRTPPGAGPMQGQGAPGGSAAAGQSDDAELTAARERLRENPGDLETSALVGHELIRREVYDEALRVTNRALAVDPFHVESRVHRGVLRAISGDGEGGEKELRELVDLYPDAQEALLFLGAIAQQRGQKADALAYFERFSVEVPRDQRPPQVAQAIARLRQQLGR